MDSTKAIVSLTVAILMITLLGLGVWYYYSFVASEGAPSTSTPPPTPTQTQQEFRETPAGWNRFMENGYTFVYPQDATVETENSQTSVTLWGPTQEPNTEFYDGISLTISTAPLNGDTLMQKANMSRAEMIEQTTPVGGTVSEIVDNEIGDRQIFSFTVESLGIRTHIFLPRAEDMYFEVVNATQDPTGVGFEEQALDIIDSLRDASEAQNL